MQVALQFVWFLLATALIGGCSSGKSSSGKSKDDDPVVSARSTGATTPFGPRDQTLVTAIHDTTSDTVINIWKSRITFFAGTVTEPVSLVAELVPNAITQTSDMALVSPLVTLNVVNEAGVVPRETLLKNIRIETIVDRFINDKETVQLMHLAYGTAAEEKLAILPDDLQFAIQEDQSRLITAETRDTQFAFAIVASKEGAVPSGYLRYSMPPPDSSALTASVDGVSDEPTEVKLKWKPGEGSRTGYLLEVSAEPITTTHCANGSVIDNAAIIQTREKFPTVVSRDEYTVAGLTEGQKIYIQLCSTNNRIPADVSPGIAISYSPPARVEATLSGQPDEATKATDLDVTVEGTQVAEYRYALVAAETCDDAVYSEWLAVSAKIADPLSPGNNRLCILGRKSESNTQTKATEYAFFVDHTQPGAFTINAVSTPSNDSTPSITWMESTDAVSYTVRIAASSSCNSPARTMNVATESATPTALAGGTWYVCVAAVDAVGNVKNATNDGLSFVIDLTPPVFSSLSLANDVSDGYLNLSESSQANALAASLVATGHVGASYAVALQAAACDGVLTYGANIPASNAAAMNVDGTYKVCARLVDDVGNIAYGASNTFVRDTDAPEATNIDSNTGNGYYRAGDEIDIVVTFSEAVTRTGTAGDVLFLLETGGTDRSAVYVSGSGGTSLTLTYTVQSGDVSADLDRNGSAPHFSYTGDRGLTDAAGNPLDTSALAATSLASNRNIIVDTTAPSAFSITDPVAASTTNDSTPTVAWSDPGDADAYDVLVDDTSGCGSPLQSFPDQVTTTVTPAFLPDGTYYLCVTTKDLAGNTTGATNDDLGFTVATGSWTATTATSAPDGREAATAVWDTVNSRMIVWGGFDGTSYLNTGGAYDPSGDGWTATDDVDVDTPEPRASHTATWTGTQMVVFGGFSSGSGELNSGGVFTPAGPDFWVATDVSGAPVVRQGHTAVWSGTRVIVWGGNDGASMLQSGGEYDPSGDSWTATDIADGDLPAARRGHTAVWTGSQMIVWGGADGSPLATGARYDPAGPDYWVSISAVDAPGARYGHTAIWTGSHMIVYGGYNGTTYLSDGAVYDPVGDSWTALSAVDAPGGRRDHLTVWDTVGSRMIVWGGFNGTQYLSDGAAYDPVANEWVVPVLNSLGGPAGRSKAAAVWGGNVLTIFGGYDGTTRLGTGSRFAPP